MTRTLLLLAAVLSLSVEAQTYVRPSKGAAFSPFSQTGLDGGYYLQPPVIGISYVQGLGPYDWSAFEAAQLRLYTDGVGSTTDGGASCGNLSSQYTISDIGAYLRFRLVKSASQGWSIQALDAPTVVGPFLPMTVTNGSVSLAAWTGCNIRIQLTPLPFAPTSVSVAVTVTANDGGTTPSYPTSMVSTPYPCGSGSVHGQFTMDGGAQTMNTLVSGGGTPTALYIIVCNSKENTGTDVIRCRADGVAPVATANAPGLILGVGDCVPYSTTGYSTVQCIGSGSYVSTYECAP